jgi:6-pyruvoyltetrahydropterin/6-carboxytetrahydropterin synthase
VTLDLPVDPESGMTLDFFVLEAQVKAKVLDRLDHRNINDTLENPTAENIAVWIWDQLKPGFPQLMEIRLFETPDSSVTYRGA